VQKKQATFRDRKAELGVKSTVELRGGNYRQWFQADGLSVEGVGGGREEIGWDDISGKERSLI